MSLGVIKPTHNVLNLHNGKFTIMKGMELTTIEKVYDEADLHYLKKDVKEINSGEVVEVVEVWQNFYGRYVRCTYNKKTYDIKPEKLVLV